MRVGGATFTAVETGANPGGNAAAAESVESGGDERAPTTFQLSGVRFGRMARARGRKGAPLLSGEPFCPVSVWFRCSQLAGHCSASRQLWGQRAAAEKLERGVGTGERERAGGWCPALAARPACLPHRG